MGIHFVCGQQSDRPQKADAKLGQLSESARRARRDDTFQLARARREREALNSAKWRATPSQRGQQVASDQLAAAFGLARIWCLLQLD